MKLQKLRWLIYFFIYRLNRWLGGITKWERKDAQARSYRTWEFCMMFMRQKELEIQLGVKLHPILYKIIDNFVMIKPFKEEEN